MSLSLEYIAGFFDGEGCINIYSSSSRRGHVRTRLRASIGNTDRRPLDAIRGKFGGQIRTLRGHNRPVFVLVWNGATAASLLDALRPFLIVKATQADLAKEYWAFMQSDSRLAVRVDRRGRKQPAKSDATISIEQAFKDRMHGLKGTASTMGRAVWNGRASCGA